MKARITLTASHEKESAGDAGAMVPPEFCIRASRGGETHIDTRIEPPAAIALISAYAASLGGSLSRLLDQAPAVAASATLTVTLDLP